MQLRSEPELSGHPALDTAAVPADRPAGDDLGERGDVGLRVAAADAERVQLEDLAREVLVDADLALGLAARRAPRRLRMRTDGEMVIEVQEHRRVRLGREQQRAEVAEHVRPDRLALEAAGETGEKLLVDGDREVVSPELRQPLGERTLGCRLLQPRGDFARVDGPEVLRQLCSAAYCHALLGGSARHLPPTRAASLARSLERLGEVSREERTPPPSTSAAPKPARAATAGVGADGGELRDARARSGWRRWRLRMAPACALPPATPPSAATASGLTDLRRTVALILAGR